MKKERKKDKKKYESCCRAFTERENQSMGFRDQGDAAISFKINGNVRRYRNDESTDYSRTE